MAHLIVMSGEAGVGTRAIAKHVAKARRAVFLPLASIVDALGHAQKNSEHAYTIMAALAEANLRLGLTVIADCPNPSDATRRLFWQAADAAGASCLDVEVVASAAASVEAGRASRQGDGLHLDTSRFPPEDCARLVLAAISDDY